MPASKTFERTYNKSSILVVTLLNMYINKLLIYLS